MTRWMQALALALAAVVAVPPAFAQLSYAQAVPIPAGEELDDAELATVAGEGVKLVFLAKLALKTVRVARWVKLAATTATLTATTTMQRGCERAVEVARTLPLRGLSFTSQHPLATNISVGAVGGGLTGGLLSGADTTLGKVRDAGISAFAGGFTGAVGTVLTDPRWRGGR